MPPPPFILPPSPERNNEMIHCLEARVPFQVHTFCESAHCEMRVDSLLVRQTIKPLEKQNNNVCPGDRHGSELIIMGLGGQARLVDRCSLLTDQPQCCLLGITAACVRTDSRRDAHEGGLSMIARRSPVEAVWRGASPKSTLTPGQGDHMTNQSWWDRARGRDRMCSSI